MPRKSRIILGAAVIDDVMGLVILAAVAASSRRLTGVRAEHLCPELLASSFSKRLLSWSSPSGSAPGFLPECSPWRPN